MTTPYPIRIVSGSHKYYEAFLSNARISPNHPDYIYVQSDTQLRGVRGGIVLVLVTAPEGSDWDDILIVLRTLRNCASIVYQQE